MTSLQTYGRRGEVSVFCSPRPPPGAAAWNTSEPRTELAEYTALAAL